MFWVDIITYEAYRAIRKYKQGTWGPRGWGVGGDMAPVPLQVNWNLTPGRYHGAAGRKKKEKKRKRLMGVFGAQEEHTHMCVLVCVRVWIIPVPTFCALGNIQETWGHFFSSSVKVPRSKILMGRQVWSLKHPAGPFKKKNLFLIDASHSEGLPAPPPQAEPRTSVLVSLGRPPRVQHRHFENKQV